MFKRENEKVEFKKSTGEASDAMKSVSGMLNKFGSGEIYFGVKNDGTVIKNIITDSSLRDVSRAVYESIEPKIFPFVEVVKIEGIEVVKLSFQGNNQPYSSKGVYYIRVSDENRSMTQKELLTMFQNKHYEDEWERDLTKYTVNDIDDETLENFYNHAVKANRLEMDVYNKKNLLIMLGLLEGERLNNAGYYLFGKNCNLELKMAVYATKEKINFIDLKIERNNIYNLVSEGIKYIYKNINWNVVIGNRKRTEVPEIPEKAIREIVVNSFAHAKYGHGFLNEINIFPNEIEIYNQGSFPENYIPKDFIEKKISSMKRNPLILDVLFRSKDVEKSGTGLSRVNDLCKKEKIDWAFEKINNGFKFIFKRKMIEKNNSVDGTVHFNLTKDEEIILKLIKNNPKIKIDDIAKSINFSSRTIQRIVKKMTSLGIIERIGTKSGFWKIIE